MQQLLEGYRAFRAGRWPAERALFEELAAEGQRPETLVISCSDSRADPSMIFSARPGELFVVRNIAGIVPPFEEDSGHRGTSAALAFAVVQLKVRQILILGHAQCGGIAAALEPGSAKGIPFLEQWIDLLEPVIGNSAHIQDSHERHVAMERDCIRLSLANLMGFPFVAERVRAGALTLQGARFGIADGQLEMLEASSDRFLPVT